MAGTRDPLYAAIQDTGSPRGEPILLPYQREWVADKNQLKVCEKSRRIGITWAEASDDVLIAGAEKPAGGQNVYYIGYNQDMAIEFIEACAQWARAYHQAADDIEEGYWEDDGDRDIKTFTIRFPRSGHRIVALSSRPANLRGKQGVIVIDEAAFHEQLGELLKAAMAMMIWGGSVRVLSTHNGQGNPFNDLVESIRAGRRRGSVHRTEFREAVAQGLFQRVCLRTGRQWSAEAEQEWVDEVYSFYGEDALEELDVIPAEGEGVALSRAIIEARMVAAPVVRLACEPAFKHRAKHLREAEIRDWCERELLPLLEVLPEDRNIAFGEDFGRRVDLSVLWPMIVERTLKRRTPFIVEMANVPFEQQRQVLFYVVDRFARLQAGNLDATGNGAYLAEVAVQQYGSRIQEVMLNVNWYRENMPPFIAAFEDGDIEIPKDSQILEDLRALKRIDGVIRLPSNTKQQGRHGDAAIAGALAWAATLQDDAPIEFQSAPGRHADPTQHTDDVDDLPSELRRTGTW